MLGSLRDGAKQAAAGVLLSGAGAAALLFVSVRGKGSALIMGPGLEGGLTVGVMAIVLALLHGVNYLNTVAITLPIFVLQYVGCRAAGEPSLGMFAIEWLALGLYGLVAPLRAASAVAAKPARARREARELAGRTDRGYAAEVIVEGGASEAAVGGG
jgi:hypothetical protein